MRKIIFIALMMLLNIFVARGSSVIAALQGQMNIDAYVDAEKSGIGGGGILIPDSTPPVISDVQIFEITTRSAKVSWKTNENASAYLYYGKTLSYEIGILQGHPESIGFFHKIAIGGLEEGMKYYFQLRSLDSAGNQGIKDGYSFTTLSSFVSPPNVINFTAQSFEGKIVLSWSNPPSEDFAGVQINKSIGSPALSPQTGEVIYSGAGESFDDMNVENGIRYFYTAFSYDSAGNFSSGAVASAIGVKIAIPPAQPPIIPEPPVIPPKIFPSDVDNLETVPDLKNKEIEIKWDNPDDKDFEEVEIYKSKDFPAMTPAEGEIIYKGKESGFKDKNIKEGEVYYYTAFTKDKSGNYSAGRTATGTLEKLPISPIESIGMNDINFIFSREALLLPQRNDKKIYAFPKKEINIYYDSKNLPKTLKTIMITVGRSSYILSSDNNNKFYRAKFISPNNAGNYPITISVLDFQSGKIFQARAELVVEDYGKAIGKLSDLDSVILKIKNYFGTFGEEKYPLENAEITIYEFDEDKQGWNLWDANKYNQENPQFTDKGGTFGFMVPNGKYKISVRKGGYNSMEETIDIGNNLVNGEFEIRKESDWILPLAALAVLALAIVVWRVKWRRRK